MDGHIALAKRVFRFEGGRGRDRTAVAASTGREHRQFNDVASLAQSTRQAGFAGHTRTAEIAGHTRTAEIAGHTRTAEITLVTGQTRIALWPP